jgi:nitrite reductase (NADH) large subunit
MLPDDPLEALCSSVASGGASAGERMVCNCNKVNAACLREAVEAGATTVEALGIATKAGTGCGSCKSELTQIIAKHAAQPAKIAAVG